MRCFKSILLAIMVALSTVGTSNAASLGVTPNLGVITNASVRLFAANGTTLLGTGNTGPTGVVTVDVGAYKGPVVVVVSGNATATYFDEAAGTLVPFPAGSVLRALVPSPGGTIAVTTLTDIAFVQALARRFFPVSRQCVNALNNKVRQSLARGLKDILTVPTPFDENTTAGSLAGSQAGRYAAILAALKRLRAEASAPGLAILKALQIDAADGIINGSNFVSSLKAAIRAVAADFGNRGLRRIARLLGPVSKNVKVIGRVCRRGGGGGGGGGGGTGGTGSGGAGF